MPNCFDGAILLDTGLGTPAAPGSYLGFGRASGGTVSTGPRVYAGTGSPAGVLAAPRGSLYLRADVGMAYLNTDGATTWVQTGTLAGAVALSSVDSTATANFDWTLADNSATAFSFDAAGAAGIFGLDTTNGGEHAFVGQEMRVVDNAALTFGDAGADLVLTSDGTGVTVTGTPGAVLRFDTDTPIGLGLGTGPAEPDAYLGRNSGIGGVLLATRQHAGGAGDATDPIRIATGPLTINAAAVGGASGGITIISGGSDVTNAGGSSAGTGQICIETGDAASAAGAASGPSGTINIETGDSADDVSGDIVLTTGTAGTTRGVIDVNAPSVDFSSQATYFDVIDNSANALTIRQGASPYINVVTTNGAEAINFGALGISPEISFNTVNPINTDGIDHGSRMVLVEQCTKRPFLEANLDDSVANNAKANHDWVLMGTNAANASQVFYAGGGIQLTTTGAANDQAIMAPHTSGADNAQTPWQACTWSSSQRFTFKFNLQVIDTANVRAGCGWKQTATALDTGTDNDQCWVGFDSAGGIGGAAGNWTIVYSVGGVDTQIDTGIAASAGSHRIVLYQLASRAVQVWIDGVLAGTTAALGAGVVACKPFVGVQTLAAATRALVVQRITGAINYY